MTKNIEVSASDTNLTCDEMRDAVSRLQALVVDQVDAKALMGGATAGGDLLPGSTMDGPNNTAVEVEIQRIQQAMADKGCD